MQERGVPSTESPVSSCAVLLDNRLLSRVRRVIEFMREAELEPEEQTQVQISRALAAEGSSMRVEDFLPAEAQGTAGEFEDEGEG